MVGVFGIRGNRHKDAHDTEKVEDQGPPCEVGEPGALDSGYDGTDEGDDPSQLRILVSLPSTRGECAEAILTKPMEVVASAKGSPITRPTEKPARWLLCP